MCIVDVRPNNCPAGDYYLFPRQKQPGGMRVGWSEVAWLMSISIVDDTDM